MFDKLDIWHLTCKNLHKNKPRGTWHTRFRFWHVVWLVKEKKPTRQLIHWKLKWHDLLGMWHWGGILEEIVDVNWHSFSFLKTSRDTLDLSWTTNEICQTYNTDRKSQMNESVGFVIKSVDVLSFGKFPSHGRGINVWNIPQTKDHKISPGHHCSRGGSRSWVRPFLLGTK